jgi:hypothetical protein
MICSPDTFFVSGALSLAKPHPGHKKRVRATKSVTKVIDMTKLLLQTKTF